MAGDVAARREWRLSTPWPGGPTGAEPSNFGPPWGHLPPVIARVLANRGVATESQLHSFLNPPLHDPNLLPGVDDACRRLHAAINDGETVGVFGDFDVDGVTATALLAQGLEDLGARVIPYIPDRMAEGHGPNRPALLDLSRRGASVLVTVDCGITSNKEMVLAHELGMDVIITDHHEPPELLPPALAIIDPKLGGSDYPFSELSGAGLAFKLVQGLYEGLGRTWPRSLLELAALSTVADLVPLSGENRYLVREGLKELGRSRRLGLLALYRRAGVRAAAIDAETISFMIAPRLNAAGRLEHASTSYRLLLTDSQDEAEALSARLETLNHERRELTEAAWERAREEVLAQLPLPPILLVCQEDLSPGIAGLVASRLVEQFSRPAVVMSLVEGTVRASARTVPGFHLVQDGLSRCSDLFERYGGHAQAAGFHMEPGNLSALKEWMLRLAEHTLGQLDLNPWLDIDAEVPVSSLVGETFRWLKELKPFGVGNPAPTFLTRRLQAVERRTMGAQGQHLRLKLREGNVVWDAVAFRQAEQWVPNTPLLDVVYNVGTSWRGDPEVLELKVLDFRPSAVA